MIVRPDYLDDTELLGQVRELRQMQLELDNPQRPYSRFEWGGRSRQEAVEEIMQSLLLCIDEAKARGLDTYGIVYDPDLE